MRPGPHVLYVLVTRTSLGRSVGTAFPGYHPRSPPPCSPRCLCTSAASASGATASGSSRPGSRPAAAGSARTSGRIRPPGGGVDCETPPPPPYCTVQGALAQQKPESSSGEACAAQLYKPHTVDLHLTETPYSMGTRIQYLRRTKRVRQRSVECGRSSQKFLPSLTPYLPRGMAISLKRPYRL